MNLVEWRQKLEPDLMEIHGVCSVAIEKNGLVITAFKEVKEKVYDIFERMAPDLPFVIRVKS